MWSDVRGCDEMMILWRSLCISSLTMYLTTVTSNWSRTITEITTIGAGHSADTLSSASDFIFLASSYENGWPVLTITSNFSHWQCTVSIQSVYGQHTIIVRLLYGQRTISARSVYDEHTMSVRSAYNQCTYDQRTIIVWSAYNQYNHSICYFVAWQLHIFHKKQFWTSFSLKRKHGNQAITQS